MTSGRAGRWLSILPLALAAIVVVAATLESGGRVAAVVSLVVLAAFGWWSWPARRGRHVDHRQAVDEVGEDGLIVYWRPG